MSVTTPTMQELLEAGVHFGHKVSRGHPRMKPYIYGAKDGVHIIDLAKTEAELKKAVEYVYELGRDGKTLLVVATKKQAQEIAEELAKEVGAYYVTIHWVGGLLTNFDEIKRNFARLNSLKKEQEAGQLKRYTKKEQMLIGKRLQKFHDELGGVALMDKVPDAMFIVDTVTESTAVKEGLRLGLKMVGFADTNSNPNDLDYPIPSNDDGIKAIKIVCEAVLKAYGEGKTKAASVKAEADKKAEEEAKVGTPMVDGEVAEQAAVIEEEIEQKVLQESERKVS